METRNKQIKLKGYLFTTIDPWLEDIWNDSWLDQWNNQIKNYADESNGICQRFLYIPQKSNHETVSINANYYCLIGHINVVREIFQLRNGQYVTVQGINHQIKNKDKHFKGYLFVRQISNLNKNLIDLDKANNRQFNEGKIWT